MSQEEGGRRRGGGGGGKRERRKKKEEEEEVRRRGEEEKRGGGRADLMESLEPLDAAMPEAVLFLDSSFPVRILPLLLGVSGICDGITTYFLIYSSPGCNFPLI